MGKVDKLPKYITLIVSNSFKLQHDAPKSLMFLKRCNMNVNHS